MSLVNQYELEVEAAIERINRILSDTRLEEENRAFLVNLTIEKFEKISAISDFFSMWIHNESKENRGKAKKTFKEMRNAIRN